ncbi:gliding motility lipoprotein GldH [Joostella sp. CR20]|uniref:gliding motility lipoprotein GldH n=1 Tax=Joostella sp. CR20 TaxID=2804312 RepID=UPI00313F1294
MHKQLVFLCLFTTLFVACTDSKSVYNEYTAIHKNWAKDAEVTFEFQPKDTLQAYNLFINIRNDNDYKFSNLFLIVNMDFPNGKTIADTLEYEMAKPNGEWLGKGFSSLKENKLFYKENVIFPSMGNYRITVAHAMRKNGSVTGVKSLEGITDVGISIEKSAEK